MVELGLECMSTFRANGKWHIQVTSIHGLTSDRPHLQDCQGGQDFQLGAGIFELAFWPVPLLAGIFSD